MFDKILHCVSSTPAIVTIFFMMIYALSMSNSLRYRAKFAFFIIASALSAGLWIPFMFFRMKSWKNALMPARCVVVIAKIIGIQFHLRGLQNVVQDSGCIVLLNHQSSLDLCVLGELWLTMERCTVISKKEILYLGPFGLAAWLWGTMFIDRGNAEKSRQSINDTAKSIRKEKRRLVIFPEGHRHSNDTLLPFKKGAFHVAIESQTPIQPVVVSKYYFLNDKRKEFRSGHSYITILPAIPTTGMTKDDLPKLIEQTYQTMNESFFESTTECFQAHVRSSNTA